MRVKRTDLAMESNIGADWQTRTLENGIERTVVTIEDELAARELGRPKGMYVTLSCPQTMTIDLRTRTALSEALAQELRAMLPGEAETVLVTGLGNRLVTPDALGPRTVERVLVTRHMDGCLPAAEGEELKSVCAAAPGVLGVTGLETAEVLRGMVEHVKPDAVIAVDALAARSSQRICSTIQIADTGIIPGSGVGNHRSALTKETLGVPVLALGVPMVIYAATIARDAFEMLSFDDASPEQDEALDEMTNELLAGSMGEMIVTPREVDDVVSDAAGMLACGINRALHPGLSEQDVLLMMN